VRILLDTHILLWWMEDSPRLSGSLKAAIAEPQNTVYLSAASIWEISIKSRRGKVSVSGDFLETVLAQDFLTLAITPQHAWAERRLPEIHGDPFDRILLAQALVEGLALATADDVMRGYPVALLR